MTKPIIYGIKNCDTIKKARSWMSANGVDYQFHDYRSNGIDRKQLKSWCQQIGWEILLNKRGTTWRQLPDTDKENINEANAIALMYQHPAMIKRPVLIIGQQMLVGFSEKNYQAVLLS